MPYAKMGWAKKIAKMKFFLPLPPLLQECQNCGRDAVFAPLLVPPPPPLPCPILHLALLSQNDESGTTYLGIQDCHNVRYFNPDADVPQSR